MNNFEEITKNPETLGAFLRGLPVIEAPWDEAFQRKYCAGCGKVSCDDAFARNGKKDVADEAKSDATVLTEIGYIKANTDEIKAEQKEQRKTNVEVVTRLTAVEASAKQAHKRLDTFENRERHEHEE